MRGQPSIKTDNTRHSQTDSYVRVGFETINPTKERPQAHALNRTASGISCQRQLRTEYFHDAYDTKAVFPDFKSHSLHI
jgi:hypothetical protein